MIVRSLFRLIVMNPFSLSR